MREKISKLVEWIFLIGAILLLFKGEIELAMIELIISHLYVIRREINNIGR